MVEGDPWQSTLIQMGLAHDSTSDKETVFLNNLRALRLGLRTKVSMKTVIFPDGARLHAVLPLKELAVEILEHYPGLLFFGHGYKDLAKVETGFAELWQRFEHTWPQHEVYEIHKNRLNRCTPCRIHADEGTSFRRAGIYQQSWGPL